MTTPHIKQKRKSASGFLEGQLLVAMPRMTDRRFARSVIFMCAHSEEGAMGIIVNQRATQISAPDLLERLGIRLTDDVENTHDGVIALPIHIGGPVESGRGFVLHSADYFADESTLAIDHGVCLTATIDILRAIAERRGPQHALLALGYAGWSAGQLESEIQHNGWLNCPADLDLIFDSDLESKYARAMAKLGVDLSHLVNDAGHA